MTPEIIWFLVGLILILAEFALPGIIFVFIGLGAWAAALATWQGWTPTLTGQTAVFGAASLLLLFTLRGLFKSWFLGLSRSGQSEAEMEEFIGKTARALAAIPCGGEGKVEFKGAHWTAFSTDEVSAGEPVVITHREGLSLRVAKRMV